MADKNKSRRKVPRDVPEETTEETTTEEAPLDQFACDAGTSTALADILRLMHLQDERRRRDDEDRHQEEAARHKEWLEMENRKLETSSADGEGR